MLRQYQANKKITDWKFFAHMTVGENRADCQVQDGIGDNHTSTGSYCTGWWDRYVDIKMKSCELQTETSRAHTASGVVVKHAPDPIWDPSALTYTASMHRKKETLYRTHFLPTAKATMVEKFRVKKYFPPASTVHASFSDNCWKPAFCSLCFDSSVQARMNSVFKRQKNATSKSRD